MFVALLWQRVADEEIDIQKLLHIQAFSARSFLQTLIYHEFPVAPGAKRAFIVISVPTEGEAANVRGMYACAEIVQETEEGVELICVLTVSLVARIASAVLM